MLEIWGRKTSSNVQALMWTVGELGLAYIRHDAGHRFGGTDTAGFTAMNPNRTVPVLRDGTNPPLWETGAILRYLAARYGNDGFWPSDLLARTEVDRWAEWAKINVATGFTVPVFWRVVRTSPADRDPAATSAALAALEDKLTIADRRLAEHPYLAGAGFTLADIQFGHVLYRYFDIDIPRADLPALRRYYDRLTQRPAYREHVMVPYQELRVG
ncbi:MAG: glutathione S-transferase family protein [Antarcticimicrobium sp.]|uniref:glutathione S-transferase family protein n=1 Tax=Antarcticimicrobium sp. TaxID=2824147 RepID=UPI0026396709|nr:glutathione S-transferase family protein [Antarcticimicrobium sp.]MDF1715082.1 glutathione S-transferase family protein [Antarcticimicrobium sp.]